MAARRRVGEKVDRLVVNGVGADLWVVEGGRFGPFAESSAVPGNLDRRVEGVSGVESTRRFIQYNQQFTINGEATITCGNIKVRNATLYLVDRVLQPT